MSRLQSLVRGTRTYEKLGLSVVLRYESWAAPLRLARFSAVSRCTRICPP